jgi:Tyosinase C-terminal domain
LESMVSSSEMVHVPSIAGADVTHISGCMADQRESKAVNVCVMEEEDGVKSLRNMSKVTLDLQTLGWVANPSQPAKESFCPYNTKCGPQIPPNLSAFMIPSGVNFLAQPAAGGDTPPVAHGASTTTEATSTVRSVAEEVRNPTASQESHPSAAERGEPGSGGPNVIYDWTVRIHFKSHELGQSFSVLIFLGDVPDDPSQWMKAPSYVGSHVAFVSSAAEQYGNSQSDTVSEGFVHLNSVLARRSGLPSFEPHVVSPYLRENLHWRIKAVRCCAIVHRNFSYFYYSF